MQKWIYIPKPRRVFTKGRQSFAELTPLGDNQSSKPVRRKLNSQNAKERVNKWRQNVMRKEQLAKLALIFIFLTSLAFYLLNFVL